MKMYTDDSVDGVTCVFYLPALEGNHGSAYIIQAPAEDDLKQTKVS
jgi:hypothetical protein